MKKRKKKVGGGLLFSGRTAIDPISKEFLKADVPGSFSYRNMRSFVERAKNFFASGGGLRVGQNMFGTKVVMPQVFFGVMPRSTLLLQTPFFFAGRQSGLA